MLTLRVLLISQFFAKVLLLFWSSIRWNWKIEKTLTLWMWLSTKLWSLTIPIFHHICYLLFQFFLLPPKFWFCYYFSNENSLFCQSILIKSVYVNLPRYILYGLATRPAVREHQSNSLSIVIKIKISVTCDYLYQSHDFADTPF